MSATKFNGNAAGDGTFGTAELCTWPVGPGVCRFQTRSPEFARKLADRTCAKPVGWSVDGGYLRIFQENIEPWRARQLVTRYLTRTNGATLSLKSAVASDKSGGRVTSADKNQRPFSVTKRLNSQLDLATKPL